MRHMPKILIGIQARSTSSRLPGKSMMEIKGRKIIDYVLEACRESANYLTTDGRLNVEINLAALVPSGDPLADYIKKTAPDYYVVQGPEHDVLKRYEYAVERYPADRIVRITGDCPFLKPAIISKAIRCAVLQNIDYVFNCDADGRTHLDGWDVEVISRKLLTYLFYNAKTPHEREHVSVLLREKPLKNATFLHLNGPVDQSHIKWSIDTQEDLDRTLAEMDKVDAKRDLLRKKYPNIRFAEI